MLSQTFFWIDYCKKSHNLLLLFIWLLVPVTWIHLSYEKYTIDQQCSCFLSLHICKCIWNKHNKIEFYLWHIVSQPFLKLIVMCTILTWVRVGCHVHNVNLNSSWLLYAQYEFEFKLTTRCTMWTWTLASCYVSKT